MIINLIIQNNDVKINIFVMEKTNSNINANKLNEN